VEEQTVGSDFLKRQKQKEHGLRIVTVSSPGERTTGNLAQASILFASC